MPREDWAYAGAVLRKDRTFRQLYFHGGARRLFPRCERLITILNGLQVSADAIFCDVIDHAVEYKENELSRRLSALPAEEQNRILQMLDLMIKQAENNK